MIALQKVLDDARDRRKNAIQEARVAADRRFVADIQLVIDEHRGGVTAVAEMLGMSRTNIHRLLRMYGKTDS